jgi:hypothetical protein
VVKVKVEVNNNTKKSMLTKLPYTAKIEQSIPVKDNGYKVPDYNQNMYELHVCDFRASRNTTNEVDENKERQKEVPSNRRRF